MTKHEAERLALEDGCCEAMNRIPGSYRGARFGDPLTGESEIAALRKDCAELRSALAGIIKADAPDELAVMKAMLVVAKADPANAGNTENIDSALAAIEALFHSWERWGRQV